MGIKAPGRTYLLDERPELIPVGLVYPRTIEKEVVREVRVVDVVEKQVRVEVESHAALLKRKDLEAKLSGLERDYATAKASFEKALREKKTEIQFVDRIEMRIPKSFYYYASAGSALAFALGAILL